jgi:aryl-alcohol dehydrogenase-like predicted oxidoreductase
LWFNISKGEQIMNNRPFGKTGALVGEVGLGCWQFGGDFGPMDDETAFRILDTAVEMGVNFWDTADVYGAGRSESLIGRYLKEHPHPVFVATKLGRGAIYPNGYTRAAIREATENSLQRLGMDALDLTQLHCIPPAILQQGDVFDWLRELKQEGKIRNFGASVESMDEALLCLEQEGLASLQIIFNLFRQKPVTALFPRAQAKGVAIIVRLPLASGLLSGKFTAETRFAATDHRTYNRDGQAFNVGETFAGLPFDKGVVLADGLRPFVPAGLTMAHMALRWILDHDAVSAIIPGATRPDQVRSNAAASGLAPLGAALHGQLQAYYKANVHPFIRGPY